MKKKKNWKENQTTLSIGTFWQLWMWLFWQRLLSRRAVNLHMWTNEEAFSIWMTFVCQVRERLSINRDGQRQKDIWGKDAKKSKSNPVPMKTDQRRPWSDGRRNFKLLSWTGRTSEWLDYKLEVTSLEWRMTTNFVELRDVMYWAIFDSCKLWESNKYHQTLSAKGKWACALNINCHQGITSVLWTTDLQLPVGVAELE